MQLLIVDDEIPAVQATKCALDWEKLGINSIFTAYNILQAQRIICEHDIQLLLCDIEMPQGNGLQLLEWITEHNYPIELIFLTCHADFTYAQKAISLGSLDYLLKPVVPHELERVVSKAMGQLQSKRKEDLWDQYHPVITELFWQDVVSGKIPPKPQKICEEALRRNIEYHPSLRLTPILIKVQRWHEALEIDEERLMEFALKNSAEEILAEEKQKGIVTQLSAGTLLSLLSNDQAGHHKRCEEYIRLCHLYFCCDLSCYIGAPADACELAASYRNLQELAIDNVGIYNKVFTHWRKESRLPVLLPQMNKWPELLRTAQVEPVLCEAQQYFDNLIQQELLDAAVLHQFKREIMQLLFKLIWENAIDIHTMFSGTNYNKLDDKSTRSVEGMMNWLELLCRQIASTVLMKEACQTDFEKAVEYIHANVEEELSCEVIARYMHFHPDYLTRIFKKKTGYTLSQYITKERMKIAQELLIQTDLPVGKIASRLKYANSAQFSKAFKRVADESPVHYRLRHRR